MLHRLLPLAAAVCAALLLVLAGGAAQHARAQSAAETAAAAGLVRLDQMPGGGLLFFTDQPGLYVPAPLVSTDIDVRVAGPIARAVVTQRFTNPADVYVEGKYLFPLSEGSAVDTLRMRVGERLIEGEIKEREEAREIYEEAKAEGYVASLVEQERPNTFSTAVANIGPGETIVVQIEYQETLKPRGGVFGLRLPLVVAPRYTPAPPPLQLVRFGPDGWVERPAPVLHGQADAPVSAPVVDPRSEAPGTLRNPVTIRVAIDAGFPIETIKSLYHGDLIEIARDDAAGTAEVALGGPVPADKDFYLSWSPAALEAPYARLFAETSAAGEDHYVLMLTPPAAAAIGAERKPRDVIFVQDVSGSMQGESIEQARKGLEMAIRRLRPEDRFNVIVFNNEYGVYSDTMVQATPAAIEQAAKAVSLLVADGGTEMLPALEEALKDPTPNDETRLRQVVFLTDGAVTNERDMLRLIAQDLGRSRLFTVGIGSAPNSYFMTAAAEAGRGSHVFIGDLGEVQERMETLFRQIETPAMTDLSLTVAGADAGQDLGAVEIWPSPLSDLYAGDPLYATIRVPAGAAATALTLSGQRAGAGWSETLSLSEAAPRPGVSKLWARERIRSLEALRLSSVVEPSDGDGVDAEILATALDNGLVSRLTSLVAVDVTPTRPADARSVSKEVPLALPEGWDPEAFFDAPEAGNGDGAAPMIEDASAGPAVSPAASPGAAPQLSMAALSQLQQAAATRAVASFSAAGAPIPATGSGWGLTALIGALMMLSGALLWRRRA